MGPNTGGYWHLRLARIIGGAVGWVPEAGWYLRPIDACVGIMARKRNQTLVYHWGFNQAFISVFFPVQGRRKWNNANAATGTEGRPGIRADAGSTQSDGPFETLPSEFVTETE